MNQADDPVVAAILPPPPVNGVPVLRHVVSGPGGEHLLHVDVQDVEPGVSYVAEAWTWLPEGFEGRHVGLTMIGFAALAHVAAELDIRDRWQKLSVTSRIPHEQTRMIIALNVAAELGTVVFSAQWCVRRETPPPRRSTSSRRTYKLMRLDDLARKPAEASGRVARRPCLPDADVEIPPVSFGQVQRPEGEIKEWPPEVWDLRSYEVRDADLFTLQDVTVHGEQGIVTTGDVLVEDTLYLAQPAFAGFERSGNDCFELSAAEADMEVDVGAHLLCGYVGNRNYAHWWVDVVPALLVPPFDTAFDGAQLLWPKLRQSWQSQTLALLPEAQGRSIFLGEHARIACRELRLVPQITRSDLEPHPSRVRMLDTVKTRAGWNGERNRRIYVSRRDASARKLLNEEAAIALLARYGFEPVTLTALSVAEQIRLFASATHVIGAHGAGLANVMFCGPGAVLCEFQMSSNVQWSIRRLAAVAELRYGCLMGQAYDNGVDVNLRDWTIDLHEMTTLLENGRFLDV